MATIPILTTVLMIPWPALGQLFTHEKGDARWRTHTAICGHVPEDQDEIRYEAVGYIRIPMATENDGTVQASPPYFSLTLIADT